MRSRNLGTTPGIRRYRKLSAQGHLAIYALRGKAERWLDACQDEQKCATTCLETLEASRFVCRKHHRQEHPGIATKQHPLGKNHGRDRSRLDKTQEQMRTADKALRRKLSFMKPPALSKSDPHTSIWADHTLTLLFLQVTIQCAQCHAMTAAERTAPQPARSVQTCHPRNLRATATMNYPY